MDDPCYLPNPWCRAKTKLQYQVGNNNFRSYLSKNFHQRHKQVVFLITKVEIKTSPQWITHFIHQTLSLQITTLYCPNTTKQYKLHRIFGVRIWQQIQWRLSTALMQRELLLGKYHVPTRTLEVYESNSRLRQVIWTTLVLKVIFLMHLEGRCTRMNQLWRRRNGCNLFSKESSN